MEYRHLGNSGLKVSVLSFGSWLSFGKQIGDSTAEDLMHAAYDSGINFFDNAEIYARGESENVMGYILKKSGWNRSSYIISSKVYFGFEDGKPNQSGLSRKHIQEGCEAALGRFQSDYIDLYFCHRPDKETPIAETVYAMDQLIRQGKILYWGTSEWSASEILQAHLEAARYNLIAPLMEQPQYNMFEREKMEKEFLHLFKYQNMGTTIWSPLASGLLTGKYNHGMPQDTRMSIEGLDWLKDRVLQEDRIEKVKKLANLALSLGISLPVLSIAWVIRNPHVSTAILGASRKAQLTENLKALDALPLLKDEVCQEIDLILQNKPVLPPF